MNKHLTINCRLWLTFLLCFILNAISYGQSNGTSLRSDITVEHIIEFPKEGFRNEPIRLVKDEVTGNLLYNEYGGTIWEIAINSPTPSFNFKYSAFDHNLSIVQGMTMQDDVLYLVGNEEVNNGEDNVGIIAKGIRGDNNRREWIVIARTEPYLGKPETPFDHKMAGNAVSPDGQFIYVSTNSRTNHGEVAGLGREDDLNILILKIPTNPSSPINLRNDKEWLRNNGYLYAEGIRNGFDMAFDKDGNLFEVENSGQRDDPEEMNWIREGRHYGFPYRLGGNDNPIITAGYNSNNDPLVPDDQKGTPLFAYDPNFPAPPAGVTFSEPIRNLGPDADLFRDPNTGAIRDASNEGSFITTFTAHRSPVGFGFDNADIMGGNFTGDAFMASFSGNTWPLIGGDSEDLLHIELNYNGALDNYDANVYKIATGFAQPIDIVVDENIIWLAEYGDGVNRGLWKITMPCGDAAVCGTVTPPLPPPPPPTPTPTLSCDAINVEGGEGQINITGLTAPIEIVQVFDANYSPIFRCEGGDCGAEQLLTDLAEGDYIVGVQLYTANWAFICEKTNITVTVTGGENPPPPPPPSTGSANCEALTFTAEADQIIVSGLNTTYSQVEIIGQNTAWQIVPICAGDCAETQIIPNLTEGEYNVKVQLNASDGTNCYREEKVMVGGIISPPPPSPSPPPTNGDCEDLNIFAANSELFIQGLTAPIEIVQIFDQNYQLVFRCQGTDCGSEQIISDLAAGSYFVNVQFYTADWRFICAAENIVVSIAEGGGNTGGVCEEAEKNGFTRLGNAGDKTFYLSNGGLPIDEAKQACITENSRLATNLSTADIDFIRANINNEAFIDLSDANREGNFQWGDGSAYAAEIFDNNATNDLVFIAAWNNQLIATNEYVWKQFVCEVACTNSNDSRSAPLAQLEQSIKLFPNPAQSIINLQVLPLLDKKGTIQIFNVYGQLVQQFEQLHFKEIHHQLDIPNYENGLYWLTIQAENMPLISKRFVVEQWR